jgi:hypothetical protein
MTDYSDYVSLASLGVTPGADNTAAIQTAINNNSKILVPAGEFRADGLVVNGKTGFRMHFIGTIKRRDNSPRQSIIAFVNCTDTVIDTINTDGNVMNNKFAVGGTLWPVDEAKHDIRLDNCTNFTVTTLNSKNPAGDSIYIAGGSTNNTSGVYIDTVNSISDSHTGRNAVSIIKGSIFRFRRINSVKTGHQGDTATGAIAMPSGFDIEPNDVAGDSVSNVVVKELVCTSAGGGGLGIYSVAGRQISDVTIDRAVITKETDVRSGSACVIVRGATNVHIASLDCNGIGISSGVSIDDSKNVTIRSMGVTNVGGAGLSLGYNAEVYNFKISGFINTCTGHGCVIYTANNGLLDLNIKNHSNASWGIIKDAARGTSSNVEFRGSLAKGTTGGWAFGGGGSTGSTVHNWLLNGVDFTGWTFDRKIGAGADLANVRKWQCKNLTESTGAPTSGVWRKGDYVVNTNTNSNTKFWVCTASGSPGTWSAVT